MPGNPNHDPKTGEFSSGGAGGSAGVDPAKMDNLKHADPLSSSGKASEADFSAVAEAKRKWEGAEFKNAKLNTATTRTRVEIARKEYEKAKQKAAKG